MSLLRGQKHDFLNHLQVICGFLQLGKPERALAYTKDVVARMEKLGRLMRLKPPELALQSQFKLEEAARRQIRVEVDMATEMEGLLLSGEEAARLLDPAWQLALAAAESGEAEGRLTLEIRETEGGYLWRFSGVPGRAGQDVGPVWDELQNRAAEYGVSLSWSPQVFELILVLPRR